MNAWGITLLWTAVQVSVLCAAGAGVYLVIRRRSSAAAAWTLSAVLVAVVGLSALGVSPWPRWASIDEMWQQIGQREAAAGNAMEAAATSQELNGQEHAQASDGGTLNTLDNDAALAAAWREFAAGFQQSMARDEQSRAWRWPAWLALAMLVGIGLGVARLGVAIVAARRFGVRTTIVDQPHAIEQLERIKHELGCTQRVELRQAECLGSPCTLGWLRPSVVLPADWNLWTDDELRSVLAHEVRAYRSGRFCDWHARPVGSRAAFLQSAGVVARRSAAPGTRAGGRRLRRASGRRTTDLSHHIGSHGATAK